MENDDQSAVIKRETIESIVGQRDFALDRFNDAYEALVKAGDAIDVAQKAAEQAAPDTVTGYTFSSDNERKDFLFNLKVAEPEQFRNTARRLTDIAVWSHVINMTSLESLMDKESKDAMREELNSDPPEVTVENIQATLMRFVTDANTIWKRGLANSFAKLDRRFRSHDGWKLGSRIIIDHAFNEYGTWSYYRNHSDTLLDVERAFFILDGLNPPPHYYGILQAINQERQYVDEPRQSVLETEYFKIRVYKNGNCHLWFQRDDLVAKANEILAEYYGEVLAEDRPKEDSESFAPKTDIAKNFAHFPTPLDVAEKLIQNASLWTQDDAPSLVVLEPSAGAGNLAKLIAERGAVVDCVEVQPYLAAELQASDQYRNVRQADFLSMTPAERYDRVIMNPPFDLERDIDHVLHAMKFLKSDGLLVAVMSAGTEWRETKKARAFRDRMNNLKAKWQDLPQGSFSEVGTNVNTTILIVWKDGKSYSGWSSLAE